MSEPKLHVMFSPSAAATLRQALSETDRQDEVVCLFDNFSFGPIASDDADTRIRWVEEHLGYSEADEITGQSASFLEVFENRKLPVTAWLSTNHAMIYAGFLWWLSHIREVPVFVIEADDLNITNSEGMAKLLDQEILLSAEMSQFYQILWKKLRIENAPLRVINGGEMVSAQMDYFDSHLLSHATSEWQKMSRIVGHTMGDFFDAGIYQTGDLVLGARLADLAEASKLEWRGDLSHMQRCELRLPAN